ncbi:MAG: YciK family oxidoreductase [Gammaproteobacteria bacterium]
MFTFTPAENYLDNKTILITGASDGIGKTTALTLARFGANLILLGRDQEKLEGVYDEIEAISPGKAVIHPMDFANASFEDYKTLASSLDEHFPQLDGLIHNAALLGARTPIEFYPEQEWDRLMQVNVNAPFYLTKVLLPALTRSDDARVLFISSSVGRQGRAHWGGYAVSKFALEGLMQTLADEVCNTTSIKINSLNPGGTRTAMRRAAYPAEDPSTQPAADELMPVYHYLFSAQGGHIHGQALNARDFDPSEFQAK